jgi:hypothetical protein
MTKPAPKWNEDSIREVASKFSSRGEFQKANNSAYCTALKRFPTIMDELFERQFKWTEPALRIALSEFETKGELQKRNGSLYSVTLRRFPHLLDELFVDVLKSWDEESVIEAMVSCKTRSEFIREFPGAHRAASNRFPHLFDEFYPQYCNGRSNDVIYIWQAVGQYFNGNPVYKIGVTSERLGVQRIRQVSKSSGFDFEIICREKVKVAATTLEKKLHILGEDPQYVGIDGMTEFRALSDSALYAAISIICSHL